MICLPRSLKVKFILQAIKFLCRYVQIVASKLENHTKPSLYPGNDLRPYDGTNLMYVAAELDKTFINKNSLFTVGDGKKYKRSTKRKRRNFEYENVKLQPGTHYSVLQRTFKTAVSGKLV